MQHRQSAGKKQCTSEEINYQFSGTQHKEMELLKAGILEKTIL
jgi:hypothetical protein